MPNTAAQANSAFIRKNEHDKGIIIPLPETDIKLTYTGNRPGLPGTAGFLLENGPLGFYITGCNFQIEVLPKKGSEKKVSLIRLEEGTFSEDKFHPAASSTATNACKPP